MEELKDPLDIFVFLQNTLDRNIERALKIDNSQDESREYERAKEIDDLIPDEKFIRYHVYNLVRAKLRKYARVLVERYNYLCQFTKDTATISSRLTTKRQPIELLQ